MASHLRPWLLLLTLAAVPSAAQADTPAPSVEPPFPIPCAQALRAGPRGLLSAYARLTGERSESTQDLVAEAYARCLRQELEPRLAARPSAEQAALRALDEALETWEEALYDVRHHGASLATHLTLRSAVGRTQLRQRLLAVLPTPAPGAAALRAHRAAFMAALLRQGLRTSERKAPDPEARATFAEAQRRFLEALRALERFERELPPQGLPLLTQHLLSTAPRKLVTRTDHAAACDGAFTLPRILLKDA